MAVTVDRMMDILAGMFLGMCTPICVHTLGYAWLQMMDNQNYR